MSAHLDDTLSIYIDQLRLAPPRPARLQRLVKRLLDPVLAAVLLAVTSPMLLAAMAAVRLTSRGRALFVQPRIGHACEEFAMFKLRTMVQGAEAQEAALARSNGGTFFKLADDRRVTRVGRFLRRSSLDELPQLLNVLRGDMSLVGPRPILRSDFRNFPRDEQMRRFSVKPGMTGLWQVSGRSLTSDEERLRLDLEYVDRWSLGLDLRILFETLGAVLSGRGAT
jgi:lipopolysaccharide/colanic/teichoic acid biosynthesis glycosyltransferase